MWAREHDVFKGNQLLMVGLGVVPVDVGPPVVGEAVVGGLETSSSPEAGGLGAAVVVVVGAAVVKTADPQSGMELGDAGAVGDAVVMVVVGLGLPPPTIFVGSPSSSPSAWVHPSSRRQRVGPVIVYHAGTRGRCLG